MAALIPADVVALGVGAFFGALSRYQAGRVAAEWIASDPKLQKFAGWHTAGINIGGSFLLGGISAVPMANSTKFDDSSSSAVKSSSNAAPPRGLQRFQGLNPRTKLMLGVGFCGSFTTFSTYSVDVVTWLSEGKTLHAMKYVATNNVGGFVAAAAGMVLVKKLFG